MPKIVNNIFKECRWDEFFLDIRRKGAMKGLLLSFPLYIYIFYFIDLRYFTSKFASLKQIDATFECIIVHFY